MGQVLIAALYGVGLSIVAFGSRIIASRAGHWIVSALLFLGIQWGSYKVAVQPLLAEVQSHFQGLPSAAVNLIALYRLDQALTVIASAYAVRWSLQGARMVMQRRAG